MGKGKIHKRKCTKCGNVFLTRSNRKICGLCSITYKGKGRR